MLLAVADAWRHHETDLATPGPASALALAGARENFVLAVLWLQRPCCSGCCCGSCATPPPPLPLLLIQLQDRHRQLLALLLWTFHSTAIQAAAAAGPIVSLLQALQLCHELGGGPLPAVAGRTCNAGVVPRLAVRHARVCDLKNKIWM